MSQTLFAAEPVLCRWCDAAPSVTTYMTWPTCETCAGSKTARVRGYQSRLERSARKGSK